jgi:hypothetical protein
VVRACRLRQQATGPLSFCILSVSTLSNPGYEV